MDNTNIDRNIIEDYIKFNSDNKPKTKNETMKALNSINNRRKLKIDENKTKEKSIKFYYNKRFIKINIWENLS